MITSTVKTMLRSLGFELKRIHNKKPITATATEVISTPIPSTVDTMEASLLRCKQRGLKPNTIIDMGAARGDWTKLAKKIWPESHILMLEPLSERFDELTRLAATSDSLYFSAAAVGDRNEEKPFVVCDDLDGSGFYDTNDADQKKTRLINVVTLDSIVSSLQLKGPYFLKFDTHGHESPILNGAEKTLQYCHGMVMECYGFQISSNSHLFWEMCQELSKLGFRLADIVDIMRRPQDAMFWQCDAVFLKNTSEEFRFNSYKF